MSVSTFSESPIPYPLRISGLKIGITVADWNRHITGPLRDAANAELLAAGIPKENIVLLEVPGAFELPLGAKLLFESGCDAVICLGCVIQGDTPHFDYVCQAATEGILQMGLEYNKPCIFGLLTTLNEQQALDRAGGLAGNKGSEAAKTALWMLAAQQNLT